MGILSSLRDGWTNFHSRMQTDNDFREEIGLMSQAFLAGKDPAEAFGMGAALIRDKREKKRLEAEAKAKEAARIAREDTRWNAQETRLNTELGIRSATQKAVEAAAIAKAKRDADNDAATAAYRAANAARQGAVAAATINTANTTAETNRLRQEQLRFELGQAQDPANLGRFTDTELVARQAAANAFQPSVGPPTPQKAALDAAVQGITDRQDILKRGNSDPASKSKSSILSYAGKTAGLLNSALRNTTDPVEAGELGQEIQRLSLLSMRGDEEEIKNYGMETLGMNSGPLAGITSAKTLDGTMEGPIISKFGIFPNGDVKVIIATPMGNRIGRVPAPTQP